MTVLGDEVECSWKMVKFKTGFGKEVNLKAKFEIRPKNKVFLKWLN